MFTQAASLFSMRRFATRSAAARSGRLVNTKSAFMPQAFMHGWKLQAHAKGLLELAVDEAARLPHEREQPSGDALRSLFAGHSPGSRQARVVSHQIQPVRHLQFAVVGSVENSDRRVHVERAH